MMNDEDDLDEEKEDEEDQALESRGLEYEIKCC
jgi:hypothetical protein